MSPLGWTDVFSAALIDAGRAAGYRRHHRGDARPDRHARIRRKFPDRLFDVGIAEQHALTSAAGLAPRWAASGGRHLLDVPQSGVRPTAHGRRTSRQPVTLVLDRSGITGPDGPSHHGMWDLSLLAMVPGMRVAAPRDAVRLRGGVRRGDRHRRRTHRRAILQRCCARRYPVRGTRFRRSGCAASGNAGAGAVRGDVLIVAVGAFCPWRSMRPIGSPSRIAASVIDPRWVLPVPDSVVDLARAHRLVVTLEDGGISGGVGSAVAAVVADADVLVPVQQRGIPQEFIEMGSRGEILADLGLTAQDLARSITATVSRMQSVPELGDDALAEAPADQPADSHADD